MPLKAVAFDVDGTLYPNRAMYWRSWGLALRHLPLFRALEQVRRDLRDHPEPAARFAAEQARRVGLLLGWTPERTEAELERTVYTRWYRIFRHLPLAPGLKPALSALRAAGFKLGVLSDFPIRSRLSDLGLEGPWDAAFSSEETGFLKPHPLPFQELARRLGVAPAEVLYVGNSHTYDVEGAAAAGMPCAHLAPRAPAGSRAALTFRHYRQLTEFVFRQTGNPGYDADQGRSTV